MPVEAPGVANEVVIEGVESGAGFEATAVGVMVGVTATGVMPGPGMEMAGAIGGGVTETGEPPAVTVGPGFVPVGSGELVKEEGVAGWLAGAPAGAVVPLLAGAVLPPPAAEVPPLAVPTSPVAGPAPRRPCWRRTRALAGVPRGRTGAARALAGAARALAGVARGRARAARALAGGTRGLAGVAGGLDRTSVGARRARGGSIRGRRAPAAHRLPGAAGVRGLPLRSPALLVTSLRRALLVAALRPTLLTAALRCTLGRALRCAVLLLTGAALLWAAPATLGCAALPSALGAALRGGGPGSGRRVLCGAAQLGWQEAADRVGHGLLLIPAGCSLPVLATLSALAALTGLAALTVLATLAVLGAGRGGPASIGLLAIQAHHELPPQGRRPIRVGELVVLRLLRQLGQRRGLLELGDQR